jgi:hypothetical protein
MTHAINPGIVPPPRGLEREEPELAQEDDIPTDDRPAAGGGTGGDTRPLRDVERE